MQKSDHGELQQALGLAVLQIIQSGFLSPAAANPRIVEQIIFSEGVTYWLQAIKVRLTLSFISVQPWQKHRQIFSFKPLRYGILAASPVVMIVGELVLSVY